MWRSPDRPQLSRRTSAAEPLESLPTRETHHVSGKGEQSCDTSGPRREAPLRGGSLTRSKHWRVGAASRSRVYLWF